VRSYLNRKKLGMKLCGKCEELEAWLKWQSAPWPGLITMKPWVQITVLRKTEREINTYGKHWFPGNLKFRTLKYVYMIKHHLEIFK
jgi:hypothetical protein